MDLVIALSLIVFAAATALLVGWLAWGRPLSAARGEAAVRMDDFRRAITDLAGAEERARQADRLAETLEAARDRLAVLEREGAAAGERERALIDRIEELKTIREAMPAQFSEVAGKVLAEAQAAFLKRADERFVEAGASHEAKIKAALAPVENALKRYEDGVTKVENERREQQGNLAGLIEAMRQGQDKVSSEAAKLVNALRSAPKARGRWGEQQLKNVLETCGLSEFTDFETEVSVAVEDGRLRPDAIIRVPGGRSLVIDAKVSLNAYQDAFGAVEEGERRAHLGAHAAAMKAHVDGLSRRAYWDQFAEAPDYVIMFVPGEHFLSAALEHDPTLWDHAFQRRVLLATPTNLIAIARTVAAVWRQERLAEEAKDIGRLGKEMYDRLATASKHLKRVGAGLNSAVDNYNKFVSSFDGRVLVTARRFRDLNIEAGASEIEALEPVETLAREPAPELPGPAPESDVDPDREAAE